MDINVHSSRTLLWFASYKFSISECDVQEMRFTMSKILITGGAGFIGSNAVERFCRSGDDVAVLDNLSRPGGIENVEWLRTSHSFDLFEVDMRDLTAVTEVVNETKPDYVIHCAGQVAVTTSVANPRLDFEGNLLGTFNLLEALRLSGTNPFLIYTSTNRFARTTKREHPAPGEPTGHQINC